MINVYFQSNKATLSCKGAWAAEADFLAVCGVEESHQFDVNGHEELSLLALLRTDVKLVRFLDTTHSEKVGFCGQAYDQSQFCRPSFQFPFFQRNFFLRKVVELSHPEAPKELMIYVFF